MEEDDRDTKRALYKRRMLALLCPHGGSRLSHGRVACPLVMDGRGNSEGVRGIEVGIKLHGKWHRRGSHLPPQPSPVRPPQVG